MGNMTVEEAAWWMLSELQQQHLEVIRVGVLRVVVSENPRWYQQLCATYSARRRRRSKVRTYIKRCHVVRTLQKMAYNKCNIDTVYTQRILPFVERYGS